MHDLLIPATENASTLAFFAKFAARLDAPIPASVSVSASAVFGQDRSFM
jgi:hypothetical protein